MIDALKDRAIFNKVGGAFKLSALIQKRMAEVLEGSRPLIEDTRGMTMMEIVIEEIMQDKIAIDDGIDSDKPDLPVI